MVNKNADLYGYIDSICFKKSKWENLPANQKIAGDNKFIVNRFLSMEPEYIDLVNYIQSYDIPTKNLYKIYSQIIPKQKFKNKYLKKEKSVYSEKILSIVSSYYQCSIKEAKEYVNILGENKVEQILTDFGYDKQEIKKMKKNGQ